MDDNDDVKMVTIINQNNNNSYNVVSICKIDDKANKNLFDKDVNDQVEATPKITVNAKVVQAMKKFQAS